MILSNVEIIDCLNNKSFSINPLPALDPAKPPFNTSAIDLRLGEEVSVVKKAPVQLDLRKPGIAQFIAQNSKSFQITKQQPFTLEPNVFVLAKTLETVSFPLHTSGVCYSARIEGKSSLARCGILVHFTAPTIHAGFSGTITLEIINLGPNDFLLIPEMYVCQLIIEEVKGAPARAPNQFSGQNTAAGLISTSS